MLSISQRFQDALAFSVAQQLDYRLSNLRGRMWRLCGAAKTREL